VANSKTEECILKQFRTFLLDTSTLLKHLPLCLNSSVKSEIKDESWFTKCELTQNDKYYSYLKGRKIKRYG
jgi:hypothetical protein